MEVIAAVVGGVFLLTATFITVRASRRAAGQAQRHAAELAEQQQKHEAELTEARLRHESDLVRARQRYEKELRDRDPDPHRSLHQEVVTHLDRIADVMMKINGLAYLQKVSQKNKEENRISACDHESRYWELDKEKAPLREKYEEIEAEYKSLFRRLESTCAENVVAAARSLYDVAHKVAPHDGAGILNNRAAFVEAGRAELAQPQGLKA
jgi:chromosome segregation ATPase